MTPLAAILLALATPAAARYGGMGVVLKIDRPHRTVVLSHQEIPGFMDAMTMPFTVRDARELEGLRENEMIDFTVVDEGAAVYVENLRRHEFKSGEPLPMNAARLSLMDKLLSGPSSTASLELGAPVPDFTLIDQKGHPVTLSKLSGRVVAVSFLYTKCRVDSYCRRLSNNLGALKERFAGQLGRDLVLLTITFDPVNDSPAVLAEYAETWNADPDTWHFLTGAEDAVRSVCRHFGVHTWADMAMITHTMRTVVIDRKGRLAANLEGNEFTPRQLGDLVQSVMESRQKQ